MQSIYLLLDWFKIQFEIKNNWRPKKWQYQKQELPQKS